MNEYTLQLIFLNEADDKVTISVPNAKQSITEVEISTAMDTILVNDAFISSGGRLVSKFGAQLVTRNVTTYDMA